MRAGFVAFVVQGIAGTWSGTSQRRSKESVEAAVIGMSEPKVPVRIQCTYHPHYPVKDP
jgi:hypothetical protein